MSEFAESIPQTIELPAVASSSRRWFRMAAWVIVRAVALGIAYWLAVEGVRLREAAWPATVDLRFYGDIENGLRQGLWILDDAHTLAKTPDDEPLTWPQFLHGYLNRYDVIASDRPDGDFGLDYTPARLLVMSIWAWHVKTVDPGVQGYRDRYTPPLLHFNTWCEGAAAVFMFLLVRHWLAGAHGKVPTVIEQFRSDAGPVWFGRNALPWLMAMLAAAVFWFDPPILIDAHMWPQWDVWLLPFFLAGLWLASIEWWFAAGAAIVIGAMFKGQVLIITPIFVLWPVFGGKIGAAVRFGIGFLATGAFLVSPWLVNNGWSWIVLIMLLTLAAAAWGRTGPKHDWLHGGVGGLIAVVLVVLILTQPWIMNLDWPNAWAWLLVAGVLATPWIARRVSRWGVANWTALLVAGAIVLASDPFAGRWGWWTVGFCYGARKAQYLAPGLSCNLGAIFGKTYGWRLNDVLFTLPIHWHGPWDVTARNLLGTIFALGMIPCAAAAAWYSRRNNPRALLALTVPWILMYAMLPQMMTRYLVWGAALGAVGWTISVDLILLNLLTMALSSIMVLQTMMASNLASLKSYRSWFECFNRMHPGIEWMVVLLSLVYLYQVFVGWWRGGHCETASDKAGFIEQRGSAADLTLPNAESP